MASSPSPSLLPSLFIIAAIIAAVAVISFSIQLLFRFLSSRRRSNSLVAALPLAAAVVDSHSSSSTATTGAAESDDQANAVELIDTLPVFTLASALASLPKSTPDCAVCLCPFRPDDELRLLPACRHAFHSSCVVPWLQTTPSCPLCRSSIAFPAPPLTLPTAPPITRDRSASRSGSLRIEIGNVSHRRTLSAEYPPMPPPPAPLPTQSHQRTYSIGSSFEYTVEEELEAVVSRITRSVEKVKKRREESGSTEAAAEPGEAVAAAAGGGEGRAGAEGWLKDYVDRLASSASSSFSSRIFSGRWSYRCDGDGVGGRNSFDLEGSARREAEEGGYYGFYQWLIGA
ncbi:E3 ubiquitin-protein ligase ATL4-like [Zingiber officinale]|uniref:RING-type domain-containing protein n=1 Tax=Zingiber officinale TaxID=94328 RepID=A0A8J5G3Z2_ZINOF|nr:E3 ubiquitin-protein ligase ATL4-like [Zingiber officinale]KAG6500010.1 hypothetical protein ZIOFF_039824 [Zingiber officinale]